MSYLIASWRLYWSWLDNIARFISPFIKRFQRIRRVNLIENIDGSFTLRSGGPEIAHLMDHRFDRLDQADIESLPPNWRTVLSNCRIQFILQPTRFLCQPMELPRRAADFLDGIVRSQLDRLTPWSAKDAVFGWTSPVEISQDRLHLSVVATPRSMTAPYLDFGEMLDAKIVSIATMAADRNNVTALIEVLEFRSQETSDLQHWQRMLSKVFLATAAAATVSLLVSITVDAQLESEHKQLSRQIANRKSSLNLAQSDSIQLSLARRKRDTASSVIVLDTLSRILPDHTVLSELRIEHDKLQIVGLTHDAPFLIKLIEQSPQFARARFFAPTTRSIGDAAENFHVEAQLRPHFEVGI